MSERDFKAQIEQLYRSAPALSDERQFLKVLEARVELGARQRRGVLVGCGSIGACVSLGVLMRLDALAWLRLVASNVFHSFERLLTSIDTVHLATLGGLMLLALILREAIGVNESPD